MRNEKMTVAELKALVKEKGMDWLIAAMVEGSHGYHTATSARLAIESALYGETEDFCERCAACYNRDLLAMISSDISKMEHVEKSNPEKVKRIIQFVERAANSSDVAELTWSMLYPTLNV